MTMEEAHLNNIGKYIQLAKEHKAEAEKLIDQSVSADNIKMMRYAGDAIGKFDQTVSEFNKALDVGVMTDAGSDHMKMGQDSYEAGKIALKEAKEIAGKDSQ